METMCAPLHDAAERKIAAFSKPKRWDQKETGGTIGAQDSSIIARLDEWPGKFDLN